MSHKNPPPPLPQPRTLRQALGVAAAFLLCWLLAEGVCLTLEKSGLLYRHLNPVVALTSRPEAEARLRYVARQTAVVALGDSVLGPTALMQARRQGARASSLATRLRDEAAASGDTFVNLGADGLLLPDLDALTDDLLASKPSGVLLLLNVRMFAPEYASGESTFSRPYLQAGHLPKDASEKVELALFRHSPLFRTTRLLRTLWYHPSQKETFQRLLEKVFHLESDEELQHAALVMKTAPFYSNVWGVEEAPLLALQNLLGKLSASKVPVLVVLTPQNPSFLGARFDALKFEKNRQTLQATVRPFLRAGLTYEDWSGRLSAASFLDHCHLKPEANALLARDLFSALEKTRSTEARP